MTSTRLIGAMRLLCCIAVAAVAAAGCTSSSGDNADPALPVNVADPSGSAGPAGSAGSAGGNSAAAVWREFVTCARQNGQQTMPDPVVNTDGTAQFPQAAGFDQKQAFAAVRRACGRILDQLPANANPLARARPITAEQRAILQRYVQCMRDHGLREMPDPGPLGEITDPPGAQPGGPMRQVRDAARNVCDRILREYR